MKNVELRPVNYLYVVPAIKNDCLVDINWIKGRIATFYREAKPCDGVCVVKNFTVTVYGKVYEEDVPHSSIDSSIEIQVSAKFPEKVFGLWECEGTTIQFEIDMSDERFLPTLGELCGIK